MIRIARNGKREPERFEKERARLEEERKGAARGTRRAIDRCKAEKERADALEDLRARAWERMCALKDEHAAELRKLKRRHSCTMLNVRSRMHGSVWA